MSHYNVEKSTLKNLIGFGVAGNFAGHLEQAGETPDFVKVKTESTSAPSNGSAAS